MGKSADSKKIASEWIALGRNALLGILFGSILNVFAAMYLWNWFIAPFGVSEISLSWAFGIIFLVNLFKGTKTSTIEKFDKKIAPTEEITKKVNSQSVQYVIRPLIYMIAGFVAHWFMV